LRTFQVGQEQRTLFTFDPFGGSEEVPLPGPVFIHAMGCPRYAEEGGYPEELRKYPAVLVAYGKGQEVVAQVHAGAGTQECAIQRLLERPEIRYIHVRDREAGCYDFRVERRNGCVATEADRGNHKC
jgi:hypothetical protein